MEKSISNRFYFDYNATSPLSNKVVNFLKGGEFAFGNASSLHTEGKFAKKKISQTSTYLFELFSIEPEQFDLIYHSGGSEGINTFFKGVALSATKHNKKCCFVFSTVDHPCVLNTRETLELLGHKVETFEVDKNGDFDLDKLINQIKEFNLLGYQSVLNFTVVNNETGVYWPLQIAEKIKLQTSALIHVDAVQLVGKIEKWKELSAKLDGYTFSAHKFGALKGVGFSFISKRVELLSLISGGSQQKGIRSGTENTLGIESIKLALEDFSSNFSANDLKQSKKIIENSILELIQGKGEIISFNAANRNLNTIFLLLKDKKAETLQLKFDLAGMAVSTGSACSSGIIKENRVLINMGYSSDESRSAIRLSFSPFMSVEESRICIEKIKEVLLDILK